MHTITGLLVRTDGTADPVTIDLDQTSALDGMRHHLQVHYVDVVELRPLSGEPLDAWVDDEGLYTSPQNIAASVMLRILTDHRVTPIHGHVLLLSRHGEDTTGLNSAALNYLTHLHAAVAANPSVREFITLALHEAELTGRL